jgi:photosystem II stability/assembly factor-like uncharacterized protein
MDLKGGMAALAVDPSSPSTIYADGPHGVFKTNDGGIYWLTLSTPFQYDEPALVVDPSSSNNIYAGLPYGSPDAIFKSTDVGATWQVIGPGIAFVTALAIAPSSPLTLFAADSYGNMSKTTDGGATWNPTGFGATRYATSVAVDPTNSMNILANDINTNSVYRSTNGGTTWAARTVNGPLGVDSLSYDLGNSTNAFAVGGGALYRSTDGGDRWSPTLLASVTQFIVQSPSNPSILYSVGQQVFQAAQVSMSTDEGLTWNPTTGSLPNDAIRAVAIDTLSSGTLYLGTNDIGLLKTTDSGTTFGFSGPPGGDASDLELDPANSMTIYASMGVEGVFKSTDGGGSWFAANAIVGSSGSKAVAVDPSNSNVVYSGGSLGISKSTDGGASWQPTGSQDQVTGIMVDPLSSQTIYALAQPGIIKTTDGGASWGLLSNGLPGGAFLSIAIDPSFTSTLYAGDAGGIFKSTDAGGSWAESDSGIPIISFVPRNVYSIAVDPFNSNHVAATANAHNIFESYDGGANWNPTSCLGSSSPSFIAFDPATAGTIYANFDFPTGLPGIYKSVSGGPWTPLGFPGPSVGKFVIDPSGVVFHAVSLGIADLQISGTPGPIVASISPQGGAISGGTAVTITGSGFVSGATVSIGGPATNVNVVSPALITASTPSGSNGNVVGVSVTNPDLRWTTLPNSFVFDYGDVPPSNPFYNFIGTLARDGVTGGCGNGDFCPGDPVVRSQMAVFLLLGEHSECYLAPACTTPSFSDVPCSSPFSSWVYQLVAERITSGCTATTFCPGNPVTRASMAVFLLVAKHGTGYVPPACTVANFTDVPCSNPFSSWIYELVAEGITGGCTATTYCPTQAVSRAQMAVFLVTTFSLP